MGTILDLTKHLENLKRENKEVSVKYSLRSDDISNLSFLYESIYGKPPKSIEDLEKEILMFRDSIVRSYLPFSELNSKSPEILFCKNTSTSENSKIDLEGRLDPNLDNLMTSMGAFNDLTLDEKIRFSTQYLNELFLRHFQLSLKGHSFSSPFPSYQTIKKKAFKEKNTPFLFKLQTIESKVKSGYNLFIWNEDESNPLSWICYFLPGDYI